MSPHGPIYCETGHPWLYMAEPVNTLTNIFILLAAVLAYLRIRNSRIGFPLDISVLLILLVAVGIGSFLWHGLRTRWALQLDWIPGVLFLIVIAGFWIRMLFGGIAVFLALSRCSVRRSSAWRRGFTSACRPVCLQISCLYRRS